MESPQTDPSRKNKLMAVMVAGVVAFIGVAYSAIQGFRWAGMDSIESRSAAVTAYTGTSGLVWIAGGLVSLSLLMFVVSITGMTGKPRGGSVKGAKITAWVFTVAPLLVAAVMLNVWDYRDEVVINEDTQTVSIEQVGAFATTSAVASFADLEDVHHVWRWTRGSDSNSNNNTNDGNCSVKRFVEIATKDGSTSEIGGMALEMEATLAMHLTTAAGLGPIVIENRGSDSPRCQRHPGHDEQEGLY